MGAEPTKILMGKATDDVDRQSDWSSLYPFSWGNMSQNNVVKLTMSLHHVDEAK